MQDYTHVTASSYVIKFLITNSNFFLDTGNIGDPTCSPGDHLIVKIPKNGKGLPRLILRSKFNNKKTELKFRTISDKKNSKCKELSPLSSFITFDVELDINNFPEPARWHFELITQRLPARLCGSPTNTNLESQFSFFTLDERFDTTGKSAGKTNGTESDGSGGGVRAL